MKLGLISDIHSNYRAFKACIDYFEKENVDYYLLLGDFVSDTAYPERIMKLLYELRQKHNCMMIRGNREDYFIDNEAAPSGWCKGSAAGNLWYTRNHLQKEDIDFFNSLPISDTFRLGNYPSITICHGSPKSTREHIYPRIFPGYNSMVKNIRAYRADDIKNAVYDFNCSHQAASEKDTGLSSTGVESNPGTSKDYKWNDSPDASTWLRSIDTDILVSGHTHHRCIFSEDFKTYVNLGSCGIAIGNAGIAECAIFTGVEVSSDELLTAAGLCTAGNTDSLPVKEETLSSPGYAWDIRLLSIPYDVEATINELYESGLYDAGQWFIKTNIQTLSTGIDHASDMVARANELNFSKKGKNTWPDIDEDCYVQAAGELGIPDYQDKAGDLTYIRMATPDDAPRLLEIYAPYVTDTAITFEYEVPSLEEFRARIEEKLQKYPYYVAVKNGTILGYAYASNFHTRAAYSRDTELSIYVDRNFRHQGIGGLLLNALEEMLKRRCFINLYSVISGSEDPEDPYVTNESLIFHKKNGYIEEGCLKKSGYKFGRWYDIHYLSKRF